VIQRCLSGEQQLPAGLSTNPFIILSLFMTIYVGNLSFDAEVDDLNHLFAQYGALRNCSLPLDRETGRKRGFAFVEMANEADETKAIDDLQDVEWMGRMIRVNKAQPRTGGGGAAGGAGRARY
jgi:RNA recognition motif-containing protein